MKKAIAASVVAALAITAGVTASGADRPATPRMTAAPNGVPIPANWPADMPKPGELTPVADASGDLIRCPDGTLLRVAVGAQSPPGLGDESPKDDGRVGTGVVPRCGPGGGDDPVWVPDTVGANRVTAPARFVR